MWLPPSSAPLLSTHVDARLAGRCSINHGERYVPKYPLRLPAVCGAVRYDQTDDKRLSVRALKSGAVLYTQCMSLYCAALYICMVYHVYS